MRPIARWLIALAAAPWTGCADVDRVPAPLGTAALPLVAAETTLPPLSAPLEGPWGPWAVHGDLAVLAGMVGATDAFHIYQLVSGSWSYQASVVGPAFSSVGYRSVAVTDEYLAVGAPYVDSSNQGVEVYSTGAVYVFRRSGIAWDKDATLTIPGLPAGSVFGISTAFSGDRLLVGRAGPEPREVYVFTRAASGWAIETTLTVDGLPKDSGFGVTIVASDDAAAISAPEEGPAGAVYVFERQGTSWKAAQRLAPSALPPPAPPEPWFFGESLAISGDVLVVGVGRYIGWFTVATGIGAAYVFEREASGWVERQKLTEPTPGNWHWFGLSVAASPGYVAVGAPAYPKIAFKTFECMSPCIPGTTYIYRRAAESWEMRLAVQPSDSKANDVFGGSMALAENWLFAYGGLKWHLFTLLGELGEPCSSDAECQSSKCEAGICVPSPPVPDSGTGDGAAQDAGNEDAASDGGAQDAAEAGDGPAPTTSPEGCACRAAGHHDGRDTPVTLAWLIALLALGRARTRRRRPD